MTDLKSSIDTFSSYLKYEKRYSIDTLKNYTLDLKNFSKYLDNNEACSLANVSIETLQGYINSLNRLGLLPTTLARKASSIRSFFSFLYKKKNYI